MPQQNPLDLMNLFKTVAGTLSENRDTLNQADEGNHNHGDNMVDIFQAITQAMQEKQGADPADQLAHASQALSQRPSGSAQVYAQGLSKAATKFQGQQVTPDNAMTLIQSLLGGGQEPAAPSGQEDPMAMLGSLLGGAQGSMDQPQGSPDQMLASLLGGGDQGQGGGNQPGLDMGDIINAGMAFMDAKSQGGSNLEAAVKALVQGSAMGSSSHRSQSGALVVNTLLRAIGGRSRNR